MKIVVCVKQVPDSAAKVVVDDTGTINWGDAPLVLNPWDEYAVEAALTLSSDVTVLTVGEEGGNEALKHSLAMGCTEAVLVSDAALNGVDSQATARVLAAAVKNVGGVDLVFFGRQAIDGDGGVTHAQTARALGWPMLSLGASVEGGDGKIKVERSVEEGRQIVESGFPAVVSVVKDIGEPRYPSFMGIRKAARAKIPVWSLGDLGIDAPPSVVSWPELRNPPKVDVDCEFIDGGSPAEIAGKLADRLFEEKVI